MEKQVGLPLEVKFFELVLKNQLKRALVIIMDTAVYPEIPEIFDSLSPKEKTEFDQKVLTVIEKVLPDIILDLRNQVSALAQNYEQLKKVSHLEN